MPADLLLLNATNLPWRPIFPYAFVQVSAVARRHGLRVKPIDLLAIPREDWAPLLRRAIAAEQPRLVGLHIRQSDSVFLDDYCSPPGGPPTTRNYFPIDDNRALVDVLRAETHAPIIAGGIGYTTHARQLFSHLGLDYGSQGDPDDIFARFDDVVSGRNLGSIQSLIHRGADGVTINERGYFAPNSEREWTDEIFDEMVRFYGHAQLFGGNPPTVPVEVMRGCPFACYFCTEPYAKGQRIRYRDLDVIEGEVDFLMTRGIRRFWFICSELDIQGTKFAMALAERMIRQQEKHRGRPAEWSAYALPRLSEDELRTLQRAGYAGALNDVLSLDDANLRRAGVPYRSKQAVAFLKAVTKLDREEAASLANAAAAEGKVLAGLTQRTPKELASIIGLFLGNAHVSPTTIPTTLRRIEDEGLRESYRAGLAFPSTRIFAPDGVPICETTPEALRTYGPAGETTHEIVNPTYYYPQFLLGRLGSPAGIMQFMRYVGDTFMSTGHRHRKDWAHFLLTHTSVDELAAYLEAAGPLEGFEPSRANVARLFAPAPAEKPAANALASRVIDHVLAAHAPQLAPVHAHLGIADRLQASEYRLLEQLGARYDSTDALFADLEAHGHAWPLAMLYVQWLLYAKNLVLRRDYYELMFAA